MAPDQRTPAQLVRDALRKTADSRLLDEQELAALKAAARGELDGAKRLVGWEQVISCWNAEYREACGDDIRVTGTEAQALQNVFKRLGQDVERTCSMIRNYWHWRATVTWDFAPDPTPMGLQKHLAKVQEYLKGLHQCRTGPAPLTEDELRRFAPARSTP